MNVDEFEALMDRCKIMLNDSGEVSFVPYSDKDRMRISKIITDNNLQKLPLANFNALVQQHNPLYQTRRKLRQQKAEQFSKLTTSQVAELPIEQKLDYMDVLFPRRQTLNELLEVCRKNEANLRACLFNLDFPKSFWKSERKLADRYASLLASQPEITDKIKSWQEISPEDKKDVIKQAAKTFEYVYGTVPEIVFFTPEEERAKRRKAGLNEEAHINAAYYHNGKIHFNEERLQESDNLFGISVLFHEGTHHRQHGQNFDDALVIRIFECDLFKADLYEDEINNKTSSSRRRHTRLYTVTGVLTCALPILRMNSIIKHPQHTKIYTACSRLKPMPTDCRNIWNISLWKKPPFRNHRMPTPKKPDMSITKLFLWLD